MFENSDFEIYEIIAKLNVERHEEMKETDRHVLQMREVLNAIKDKYYEIVEHTADWIVEKRNPQIQKWLNWLTKLTDPIRSQGVEETLQEIKDEMTKRRGRKRQRDEENDDDQ